MFDSILKCISFATFVAGIGIVIYKKIFVSKPEKLGRLALVPIAGVIMFVLSFSFVIIPTGYTGVRTTFGQIDQVSVQNGFNFKIPFVQSINLVNNKQQDIEISGQIWSESKEQVQVYYNKITITYQINPEKSAWIYANVSNYKASLVSSSIVSSAIKTASKQVETADATNRGVIEPVAKECLQEALDEKYGENVVTINRVTIGDANFEDAYNQAIAERQTAQIAYEKQQIENKQAIEKAEADATVKKTEAQAEADAKIITAESEAKANQLLEESLTDSVLKQMYIEKWNGELPKVSSDSGVMIDIGNISD